MADNVTLNSGTGGATLAADDIAGVHYQRVKLSLGADGAASDAPIGGGTESGVLRVTLASDSTGLLSVDDNGGSLTVDNAALSVVGGGVEASALRVTLANDSTGVLSVDDNGSTLSIDDGSGSITIDNAALSVTGGGLEASALRVTLASDSTGVLSVDDNGASLTIDNAALAVTGGGVEASALRVTIANDSTGVLSIDDNGGSLTVDGTVAVSSITTSVTPGTAAANLGKAIDSASGATDTGVAILGIRDDALSTLTPIEGDYVPLRVNSTGALHVTGGGGGTQYNVDDVAGATDTGTLLLAVRDDSLGTLTPIDGDYTQLRVNSQGALHVTGGGGGTEYVVDAAAPANPTGATFVMERDDALSALTEIEGDWTNPRSNARGALWVELDTTNAVPITDNAGSLTVDNAALSVTGGGVEASALRVTIANDSTGLVSVDDNGGSLTVDNAALSVTGGGVEASALRVTIANDSTGVLSVDDNGSTISVDDGAGSLTVDGTITASDTTGNIAHDSADSGNPVKLGAKAVSSLETQTMVAANDRTDLYADLDGVQVTKSFTTFGDIMTERVSDTAGNSTNFSTFNAGGAGIRNYVTTLVAHNSSATNGYLDIRDGSAGSVFFTCPLPANGGAVVPFPVPLRQPTANTALAYDVSAALTTVYISLVGFQSKA